MKDEEKKKTEKAFHDFLPPSVVKDLKAKRVFAFIYLWQVSWGQNTVFQQTAERFECVTIFFGDIVGFNLLTADRNAVEVFTFTHFLLSMQWNCNFDPH